jgi:hypothetical protein
MADDANVHYDRRVKWLRLNHDFGCTAKGILVVSASAGWSPSVIQACDTLLLLPSLLWAEEVVITGIMLNPKHVEALSMSDSCSSTRHW